MGKKVVIASSLLEALGRPSSPYSVKFLNELFRAWLPFYSRDHVAGIVRGLSKDSLYQKQLGLLFKRHRPVSSREVLGDIGQVGERTLYREYLRERLGGLVGDFIFEACALSELDASGTISFGEQFANLAYRAGISVHKAVSRYKLELKKRSRVRYGLRLIGYGLSFQAIQEAARRLGIGMNFPIPLSDVGLGLILVADG